MNDRLLISRCASGDPAAWRVLVRRYQSLIYSVVRLHFRNRIVADYVFHKVCMELKHRLVELSGLDNVSPWLIAVTRRKCSKALVDQREWADVDVNAYNMAVIEERIAQVKQRFRIEQAMDRLPDACRRLIEALYFRPHRPSDAVIASALNMPVSRVGPARAWCLEKFRKEMREGR